VALKNGVNAPDAYKGEMRNKNRIGLDNAGSKELWDTDPPDDSLEVQGYTCSGSPVCYIAK
jgi:hypothetical protein